MERIASICGQFLLDGNQVHGFDAPSPAEAGKPPYCKER